ncbi:ribonuclease toxin HepT-like protein [Crocosphaera sp. Alani8]|uniref:ribonuclease toxin HepT-like protein n=1 Tax=Crocosphaera sp. Alani8 TaxID=3038952 RepID=UPI00313A9589
MNELLIQERISQELNKINRGVQQLELFLTQLNDSSDLIYQEALVNSLALNLHGIYTGIERIFKVIATEIDLSLPTGNKWHRDLLDQMAVKIPNVRTEVITEESRAILDELRRFRHVLRSAYSFQLDKQKVLIVVNNFLIYHHQLIQEIQSFCNYLDEEEVKQ